jgi:hypothetical protein
MAYPRTRSVNAELDEGATDGKYRKVVMDRGGVVEPATYDSRRHLSDTWHGIHEQGVKIRPDGRACATPYAVATPCADPEAV